MAINPSFPRKRESRINIMANVRDFTTSGAYPLVASQPRQQVVGATRSSQFKNRIITMNVFATCDEIENAGQKKQRKEQHHKSNILSIIVFSPAGCSVILFTSKFLKCSYFRLCFPQYALIKARPLHKAFH